VPIGQGLPLLPEAAGDGCQDPTAERARLELAQTENLNAILASKDTKNDAAREIITKIQRRRALLMANNSPTPAC